MRLEINNGTTGGCAPNKRGRSAVGDGAEALWKARMRIELDARYEGLRQSRRD